MSGIGSHARAAPDAAAIVTLARTVTFAELDDRHGRVAGALHAGGLATGDRVAVLSANRLEYLEVTIGALRAGIVPVPVNALLTPREAAYVVEDSGARWLFADRAYDVAPGLERVVTFGDAYERLLFESDPAPLADVALGRPMHYTSGTTGVPKGVWVPPASEDAAAMRSEEFRTLWGLAPDDVHLVCSPLAHSAPHRFALRTLEAGGAVVVQTRFEAAETLAAIELFGATSTFVVPTHLERFFALSEKTLRRHDLSSLRLLAHAGAPIRDATKRRAIAAFPPGSVWEFYGATENQATRISADEWLRKPGSVGTALPGAQLVIADDDGVRLPPGDVGDVWVDDAGAERFSYWNDADETRAAWRGDAWTAGDVGYVDDDGYLYLTGRKNDTIITGGVNVYPREVEAVLEAHPGVAEAVVYGAPHDEWGHEVRALVVASPGAGLDGDDVRSWARTRLAGFKCPRRVDVVDELPRTPTGKVRRGPPS
ncbi:MAG TPA: AMP-binding protein [Actinomycetota bacterium]|nr:AMP-binding protein [Actinomycetota bacterium]